MATLATMIERLARRFNAVTALPADAAELTMIDTFESFGYKTDADVPVTDINRLLAFASAELATQVAINAASYFKYTDGEESVDKSMVSKQYRELAAQFRIEFAAEELRFVNVATTTFYRMPRRDRP